MELAKWYLIFVCFFAVGCKEVVAMPVSYEDIVTFTKPLRVEFSPTGTELAYVTRQGRIQENDNRETLFILDRKDNHQRKLFEAEKIISLIWSKHGESLFLLTKEAVNYSIIHISTEDSRTLFCSAEPITNIALSHDSEHLYYTLLKAEPNEIETKYLEEGYVYDPKKDHVFAVISGKFKHFEKEEIWRIDTPGINPPELITTLPFDDWYDHLGSKIATLQVSENDIALVLTVKRLGNIELGETPYTQDITAWDLAKRTWDTHVSDSTQKLEKQRPELPLELCPFTSPDGVSFDPHTQTFAFIHETSTEPPEIALYHTETETLLRLTDLNPQVSKWKLGQVETIVFKTPSGIQSTGYLVHPVGEEKGKRYPLIIATYGFCGGFLTDAEWHSTFPVQTLAGNGYAVLLLNLPPGRSQSLVGNPELARQRLGWNASELFEYALEQMVDRGIADPTRVGIYGWSKGGFIVNFLLSHSDKFHVGALGEGGDYTPGMFWYGGHRWVKISENIFGGPPWGKSLEAYLEFSPFYQVEKIQAPLLLEYGESALTGFEMLNPLRYLGIPAELVIYPNEEHNFVQPKARIASMARKVEWFDFWLNNKKNPDPAKLLQYERWEQMQRLHALKSTRAELTDPSIRL